jgi:hypothetical protein
MWKRRRQAIKNMERANATYDSRVDIEPADLQTLELVRKKSSQSVPEIHAGEGVELNCVCSVAGQEVSVAVFRPKDANGNQVRTLGTHTIHVSLRNETSGEISRVPLRACGDEGHGKPDSLLELVWTPEKSGYYSLEKVTTGVSEAERLSVDAMAQETVRVDVRPCQMASLHLLEPRVVRTRAAELTRGKHLATFRRLDAFGNELESSYDLTKMELKHADTGK